MSTTIANPYAAIEDRFDRLEALVREALTQRKCTVDRRMNINELREYLPRNSKGNKVSKATVYRWVGDVEMGFPVHKPAGTLVFVQSEVDAWLASPRNQQSYYNDVNSVKLSSK